MKKLMTILGAFMIASVVLTSCGDEKSAENFQYIIDEYKSVLCISQSSSASITEKTKALTRQSELNEEYNEALLKLSDSEKSKLMMSWSKSLFEVSDGDCK